MKFKTSKSVLFTLTGFAEMVWDIGTKVAAAFPAASTFRNSSRVRCPRFSGIVLETLSSPTGPRRLHFHNSFNAVTSS
jgi:hypothetical protein